MPLVLLGLDAFPEEGTIIGRLLMGYGDLEFRLFTCLGAVLGDNNLAARVLFRARGEEARIQIADALMRYKFLETKHTHLYCETISDLHWCRKIRNQFAHSHFSKRGDGLVFVDLEESAKAHTNVTIERVPISRETLALQEEYFGYVQHRLDFLRCEYEVLVGKHASHERKLPPGMARPPMHSVPP